MTTFSSNSNTFSACAKAHGVAKFTLSMWIAHRGGSFEGSGRIVSVMTKQEEDMVAQHVCYKADIGYGESYKTL